MRGSLGAIGGWTLCSLALCHSVRIDAGLQAPDLNAVLSAAAAYVADYERQVSAVVSEERYIQRIVGPWAPPFGNARELRSDMLVVADDRWGWVGFRDVFEVDGKPVRDRAERLTALFLTPSGDTLSRARRIMDEGARFNLNVRGREIDRNVNLPMLALRFIQAQGQPRSRFRIDGVKTVDGERLAIVKFQEQASPRIIKSVNNAAAHGVFWIEPATGRVVHSEFMMDIRIGELTVTVIIAADYAFQPKVGVWVPTSMDERYTMGRPATTIEGHATYSNFRKYRVDVETSIKSP
jgi:hypothetical protein